MKCAERELLIEEFIRTLPPVEHEWDNIQDDGEYESYICRHCLGIEKRMKTGQGVPLSDNTSEYSVVENNA